MKITIALFISSIILFSSCSEKQTESSDQVLNLSMDISQGERQLTEEFNSYWYAGKAELTSYELKQERYGELHSGTAVTIFVTEDFNPEKQVKADRYNEGNISALKLNMTKKFLTGLYPYSIMTSTFNPVKTKGHALKVSTSVQDWCGQVYMQLNNKEKFEIKSHSYFESEGDQQLSLDKTWLEDEIWGLIRLNPGELPTGEITMVPSFEDIRLRHKKLRAGPVIASLVKRDSLSVYTLKYLDIERELSIYFNSSFPFEIEKWEETNGGRSSGLKSVATRIERKKLAYWNLHNNTDRKLRDSLGLPR